MQCFRHFSILLTASAALSFGLNAQTSFSNTNPITTPSTIEPNNPPPQEASPYPAQIQVSGLSGTVSHVSVTLNGWTESGSSAFPQDRDFMLVSPTGAAFEFLGGCDAFHTFSNINVTLDDSAGSECSGSQLTSGTFQPTVRLSGFCTTFPSPAPSTSNCAQPDGTASFGSVFNGSNPNGNWSLYIFDGSAGDSPGSITGGWTITITVAAAAGTSTNVSSNLNPSFTSSPNNDVTLTATVTQTSNGQPVTQSSVTFFDGAANLGTISLNGSGQAALMTSFTTEGNHNITADFNANASFGPSSGMLVQEVDNHTTGTSPTFCDSGTITLNTNTGLPEPASVYPQHVYVTGLTGSVSEINLQLPNITHNFPEDVDFLLVGPTGNFVPLASAGGAHAVSGVTLTLSDAAGSLVPQTTSPSSGTYLPSDYNSHVVFPAPAPGGPYNVPATQGSATFATSFDGVNPNGTWGLFVFDHSAGDSGSIGGYCLTFTTSSAATTVTNVSANPSPGLVGQNVVFTAQVTSAGVNVTSGTVTFEEDGNVLAGPTSLDGNGQATFTTSTLSEGIHNITVLYSGVPALYNVSSGSVTEEIDHQTTVTGTTYCNPGGITIPSDAPTQPYPSRVFVTNLPGLVSSVAVEIDGFTHNFPADADMLLTGPTGTNLVFWGDAGGSVPVSGVNVIIADGSGEAIPSPVFSGAFNATANNGLVMFPSPAPPNPSFAAPAGASTLTSSFGNIDANGTWSFYIIDSEAGSGGSMSQVCLDFTETPPVLAIAKSHSGTFNQGDAADTYTIQVSNSGPGPTGGTVTVTEVPPLGLSVTAMSGANWSCAGMTCTRSDVLAQGGQFDPITVTVSVAPNSPPSVTNQATVSGGGAAGTLTASDPTTIGQTPASITASGGTPQSANINTAFAQQLQATVLDGANVAVPGVSVTFTAPSSGPSGTFPGNQLTATVQTNVRGVATAPVFTANSIAGGPYTVAATVSGVSGMASFALTNNAVNIAAMVSTSPSGLSFTVDGSTYTTPQSFSWAINSVHTIGTTSPQAGGAGTQYVWTNWTDGGAISHQVTAPSSNVSYVANFGTQYQLTTAASPAAGGTVTPASGQFFAANTVVNVSAVPANRYAFSSWTGPVAAPNSASTTVTMTGPVSVTANFVPSGPAILHAKVVSKTGQSADRQWKIAVENSGKGEAVGAELNKFTLHQTSGTACSPSVLTTFPLSLGNIAPGSYQTGIVGIDFAGCATNARYTVTITYSANGGADRGSLTLYNQYE